MLAKLAAAAIRWYLSRPRGVKAVLVLLSVAFLLALCYAGYVYTIYAGSFATPLAAFVPEGSVVVVESAQEAGAAVSKFIRGDTASAILREYGAPSLTEVLSSNNALVLRLLSREFVACLGGPLKPARGSAASRGGFTAIMRLGYGEMLLLPFIKLAMLDSTNHEGLDLYTVDIAGIGKVVVHFSGSVAVVSDNPALVLEAVRKRGRIDAGNSYPIRVRINNRLNGAGAYSVIRSAAAKLKDFLFPGAHETAATGIVIGIEPSDPLRIVVEVPLDARVFPHFSFDSPGVIRSLPANCFYVHALGANTSMLWSLLMRELPGATGDEYIDGQIDAAIKLLNGGVCDVARNILPHLDKGVIVAATSEPARKHSYSGIFAGVTLIFPSTDAELAFSAVRRELQNFVARGFDEPPDIRKTTHRNVEIIYLYSDEFHGASGLGELFVPAFAKYNGCVLASVNLSHLRRVLDSLIDNRNSFESEYLYRSVAQELSDRAGIASPVPDGAIGFGMLDFEGLYKGTRDYARLYADMVVDSARVVQIRIDLFREKRASDPSFASIDDPRLDELVRERIAEEKQREEDRILRLLTLFKFADWLWFKTTSQSNKVVAEIYLKSR